jgi:hypothetical protein
MRSARLLPALALASLLGCAGATSSSSSGSGTPPSPDPRAGLRGGLEDAAQAAWNVRLISNTPSPKEFTGVSNTDIGFSGNYVIQGNYNGFQVWDISDPSKPAHTKVYLCPASQSDVSVFRNLLFVSGEDLSARLDCGTQGVDDTVSTERLRGLRIFDISDIRNPKNVGNVQTCRGSHTHSVLVDPKDTENVYVYISGSSVVRSPNEMAGCVAAMPAQDTSTAWFRIEVIKVPLAHPEQAAIVSSPRIFENLKAPPTHGEAPADSAADAKVINDARARGAFIMTVQGQDVIIPDEQADTVLQEIVRSRGGTGAATAQDSALFRQALPMMAEAMGGGEVDTMAGPTQCHDITLYPEIGLGGGACEGYGMLLDIRDPVRPVRTAEVSDSNFSYWHSATFNNDGTKALFSDEWGGGSQPKCRASDKKEWGADAIFTVEGGKLRFQSYYKLPATQSEVEICVAHNGSLVPIPGRDVMVQAWYSGGLSVFDWTDAANPKEIAYFDRGPVDPDRLRSGGYWSTYWYNGYIYGSEMARGLDVFELMPSPLLSQNELDAAKSVRFDYYNVQGQQKFVWPATVGLARAYLDQLERSKGLSAADIAAARASLDGAEKAAESERRDELTALAGRLSSAQTGDTAKVALLVDVVRKLAEGQGVAVAR